MLQIPMAGALLAIGAKEAVSLLSVSLGVGYYANKKRKKARRQRKAEVAQALQMLVANVNGGDSTGEAIAREMGLALSQYDALLDRSSTRKDALKMLVQFVQRHPGQLDFVKRSLSERNQERLTEAILKSDGAASSPEDKALDEVLSRVFDQLGQLVSASAAPVAAPSVVYDRETMEARIEEFTAAKEADTQALAKLRAEMAEHLSAMSAMSDKLVAQGIAISDVTDMVTAAVETSEGPEGAATVDNADGGFSEAQAVKALESAMAGFKTKDGDPRKMVRPEDVLAAFQSQVAS